MGTVLTDARGEFRGKLMKLERIWLLRWSLYFIYERWGERFFENQNKINQNCLIFLSIEMFSKFLLTIYDF